MRAIVDAWPPSRRRCRPPGPAPAELGHRQPEQLGRADTACARGARQVEQRTHLTEPLARPSDAHPLLTTVGPHPEQLDRAADDLVDEVPTLPCSKSISPSARLTRLGATGVLRAGRVRMSTTWSASGKMRSSCVDTITTRPGRASRRMMWRTVSTCT